MAITNATIICLGCRSAQRRPGKHRAHQCQAAACKCPCNSFQPYVSPRANREER